MNKNIEQLDQSMSHRAFINDVGSVSAAGAITGIAEISAVAQAADSAYDVIVEGKRVVGTPGDYWEVLDD